MLCRGDRGKDGGGALPPQQSSLLPVSSLGSHPLTSLWAASNYLQKVLTPKCLGTPLLTDHFLSIIKSSETGDYVLHLGDGGWTS